jgi:diguanylate cyclase (GGDEF)-like protein
MNPHTTHAILLAGLPPAHVAALEARMPGAAFRPVENGHDAIACLAQANWTLAVVHHTLSGPGPDALALVPALLGGPRRLPTIFLSAPRLDATLAQALVGAGVERILVDPEPAALAHEVARRLGLPTADVAAPTETAPPPAVGQAVDALWQKFRPMVLQRVDVLEEATVALMEGSLDDTQRQLSLREAHKLTGSLGTYGIPAGSSLASEAEGILGRVPVEVSHAPRLSEIVEQLRLAVQRGPTAGSAAGAGTPAADVGPLILVATRDRPLVKQLNVAVPAQGWQLRVADSLLDARHQLHRASPDALVLDQALVIDVLEAGSLIAELSARVPPLPIVVLSENATLDERVLVARAGASAILPREGPVSQLLAALEQAMRQREQATATVLAVDDDPQVLAALRAVLEPRGISVTTIDDPLHFWDTLEEVSPDLLVLDVDMPYLSGIDLCQVVRSDPRWSSIPVLFLTARRDSSTVTRVFESGADDYVSKPLVGPELVTRITNRIERSHLYRHLAETDYLTGVNNRRRADGIMERFLRLATRRRQPFSLCMVDVDALGEINERYGHSAGDRVLRHLADQLTGAFRSEDVVSRWGGAEFAVGLYSMTKELAALRVTRVLEAVSAHEFHTAQGEPFRAGFTGGIAEFPRDAADLPGLYRMADTALHQAKAAGRGRVLPLGADPAVPVRAHSADVLIVEDDTALHALLKHTLETHGLTTASLDEGPAAVAALTGALPELRVRVVLLDVDLPGLDGLSVLRRFARDGLLRQTRVIMLTARSSETEVLAALDLGAYDHVSKPFSVPVLVHRVKRAMGVH